MTKILKRCTGPCGLEKPLSEFYKHKQCKDGVCSYCKACHKQKMDAQVKQRRANGGYKEPVAKPQFRPKPALSAPLSVPAQIAYAQSDMSICAEHELAPKSSNLGKEASFATGSIYQN